MAAKKKFSAKQLAAQRKFAKIMKSGGFKKKKSMTKKAKTTSKRKPNKQKSTTKNVAAKKKGILENIPLINNPTFKKAALGVGTATIGVTVLSLVAPQIAAHPLVKPILAFAGGGVPGVVAQIVAQGGLGALSGGGNGNGGGFNPNFA